MHGFTLDEIKKMAADWEEAPPLYLQLDIRVHFFSIFYIIIPTIRCMIIDNSHHLPSCLSFLSVVIP